MEHPPAPEGYIKAQFEQDAAVLKRLMFQESSRGQDKKTLHWESYNTAERNALRRLKHLVRKSLLSAADFNDAERRFIDAVPEESPHDLKSKKGKMMREEIMRAFEDTKNLSEDDAPHVKEYIERLKRGSKDK